MVVALCACAPRPDGAKAPASLGQIERLGPIADYVDADSRMDRVRLEQCVTNAAARSETQDVCIGMVVDPCQKSQASDAGFGMMNCITREETVWITLSAEWRARLSQGQPFAYKTLLDKADADAEQAITTRCALHAAHKPAITNPEFEVARCTMRERARYALFQNALNPGAPSP
jgi:hypothetical protein